MNIDSLDSSSYAKRSLKVSFFNWLFLNILFSVLFLFDNSSYPDFSDKFQAGMSIVFFCTIGATIGNALRVFALPDAFFTTSGFFGIIKTRLFWMFGPQLVGFFIGFVLAVSAVPSTTNQNKSISAYGKTSVVEREDEKVNYVDSNKTVVPKDYSATNTTSTSIIPLSTVEELEKKVGYSGDDPIVRERLGLPPKN